MSMPSSRAFVAATASSSPSCESPLELAALLGQIACAVGLHAISQRRPASGAARELREQLRGPAAAREPDRRHAVLGQRAISIHDASDSALRRAPVSSSVTGGFHSANSLPPLGASASTTASNSRPVRRRRQLVGIADGGRGEDPPGVAAVVRDQAPQPAQHHRHVRAEHAAAHVGLVDDDERQAEEEVGPARVVGQQRQMEHVRVRHHEVRVRADQRALGARRVAVVHGGLDLRELQRSGPRGADRARAPSWGTGTARWPSSRVRRPRRANATL